MKLIRNYPININKSIIFIAIIFILNSCCNQDNKIKIYEKKIDTIKLYRSVFVITDYESKYYTNLYRTISNKDSIKAIVKSIENSCDYDVPLFHRGRPQICYRIEISDTTSFTVYFKEYSGDDIFFTDRNNYELPNELKELFRW